MRPRILMVGAIAMAAIVFLAVGCSKKKNPLSAFQPQINKAPDNFQFQATNVTNVTSTLQYTWQNTGTSANVNQACAITSGTATLTIFDALATQVYSQNLAANGTFVTSTGISGNWRIRVVLNNVSGTLNFRVQKP